MNLLKFILRYLRYLVISKTHYSIQSPFVYDLVTNVIRRKTKKDTCIDIENLRKKLIKIKDEIQISDFGAGSKINKSKTRKIGDIALKSAKSTKYGELLYRIIKYYEPQNILELGSSLGISTSYLAKGNPNGK